MYDEEDDEFIDDPISLIYDEFPEDNVQKSSIIYDVEDDVDDDPIVLVTDPYEGYLDTEIVDLRSSDDENEEQHPAPKAGYGNKNFVIPVTFLDFYRNVKLLKKCKPLSIKVVDCDKHPWYYGCRGTAKSRVNVNCVTLGKHSNTIKQQIKVEKADKDVDVGKDAVNVQPLITTTLSDDDKVQDPEKLNNIVDCVSSPRKEVLIAEPRTENTIYEKLENELETAKKSKDLKQVDFKRNSGLVGLIISTKELETNPEKVSKKKTSKKRKKENIVGKTAIKQIGVTLGNLGTSVTPIPEKRDDNILNNLAKEIPTNNNVTVQHLSLKSSDTRDKVNSKTVSPTRCSLKITSTTILEKLKKAKVQDASKTKSQQKARNIFAKDQAVPKLSLKRRPTTENDQFYVVNSNKEPYFNGSNQLPQSHEPQKADNAVDKISHKEKVIETYPSITPSISITVSKNPPDAPVIAEKLDQTQNCPRSYHKKLKLKKSIVDGAPNKIIENETIASECSRTPNNQAVHTSDCSLTSGLNQIVVSQVQSLRDLNTLPPNRPISETPKKSAIYIAKPRHLKLKSTKEIKTVANSSNVNEKVLEGTHATTYENKAKKTPALPTPPPGSFLQAYSTHVLNYFNSWQELTRKTKPSATYANKDKSDSKTLKETEKHATEQTQTNLPKNMVTLRNNNMNPTNYDSSNQASFNNAAEPPKTTLHIHRFGSKQRLEEYLNMKQHHPNTQPKPTDPNKHPPISAQVYSLPGNNTVILRKPPANLQTSTHQSPGLPIQTVVNHRPVNTPTPTARFPSPWSYPPPNTNVASSRPCNMPNMNMYPGNQLYPHPQYYWRPTNVGHQYPQQQERNTNLVPVRNEVPDDSILGSTANGEPIKKINIGISASDSTVVNDKQKMLDTLNSAIKERNDFIHKPCDPRTTAAKNKAKPCPLSKKAKANTEPHVEPSNGYSPPILPIPTFQKAIELVKMKQKAHNSLLSQVENMNNDMFNTNSTVDKYAHRSETGASKRKLPVIENKKHDKTKKISIEEYKKRVSKDGVEANNVPKHKCKRKKVSKNLVVDNNQDLGYDSDATMKL